MSTLYLPEKRLQQVHLTFDSETLELLLRSGKLHAADFKCLDKASKRKVWGMLLAATARRLQS